MRHESRGKLLLPTFLLVITSSHLAISSYFKAFNPLEKPPVINSVKEYRRSINVDSGKQMVLLQLAIPQLVLDLRYATEYNFTKEQIYPSTAAFLRRDAADKLKKVQEDLMSHGLSLKVFDAYRPYSATVKLWNLVHDERYAASPINGSGHNRGAAVDLTIVKISSNEELEMPTGFDDFTEKAHHDYMKLSKEAIANRKLLRSVMEKNGFVALETEWWHYSLPDASRKYELLDLSFDKLKKLANHN